MEDTFPSEPGYGEAVLTLWRGLKRSAELGPRARPRVCHVAAAVIEDRGAPAFRIEDYLVESGLPLDLCTRWRDLALLAGIEVGTLFWRPAARADHAGGGEGLTLADLAALAAHLERWGLAIDPAPLVSAALPAIKRQRLLTQHELTVLWWRRERMRMDPIQFTARVPGEEWGEITLPSGHRAACHSLGLLIVSPRFGRRKWADTLLCLTLEPGQGEVFDSDKPAKIAAKVTGE